MTQLVRIAQGTEFQSRNLSMTEGWSGVDDAGIVSRLSRSASRNGGVKV